MNKNQLKKVINNLQTYVDSRIANLPVSYEEKLLITVPKESIDKSKADAATNNNPYYINIPIANGFEYVDGMFNNADVIIEYNGKKYIGKIFAESNIEIGIYTENNNFTFFINKDNSFGIQLSICKLDTTNITDIKLYMRKKDININDLKVDNSISIGRVGDIGVNSSAIGSITTASGDSSHAEGSFTTASGNSSHAEGFNTTASGDYGSHAEGWSTTASGNQSHAEGGNTTASANHSHAEGDHTSASGDFGSHAEGYYTSASGDTSHAEGDNTKASSDNQHVQGKYNIEDTANKYAHIVGNGTADTKRSNAHTLDWKGNAWFAGEVQGSNIPHVISEETVLTVPAASIDKTKAAAASADAPYKLDVSSVFTKDDTKEYFITYGGKTFNIDNDDIYIRVGYNAEGTEDATKTQIVIYKLDTTNVTDIKVVAKEIQYLDDLYLDKDLKIKNSISVGRVGDIGKGSSAIGIGVEASGESSHAEGYYTTASGESSHAEGCDTKASGNYSHTEGAHTIASGNQSHVEGGATTASGYCSHAEGAYTIASGDSSHAEGYNTKASSKYQHVQGSYNIEDNANKYIHIVGNGKKDSSTNFEEVRSNAHTLDWEGNAWFAGQVEGTNLPYTVSSKVLGTVPASTILGNVSDNDDRVLVPITINNASINKDRRYYMEFLGSKKLCSLSINEEGNAAIACNIGNYVISAYNNSFSDSPNIIIDINKINKDDTTTNTFTDLVIYEEEVKYLDSKYLETDLVLQNSISLGRVGDIGKGSSAIGNSVMASGNFSHAEGDNTTASAYASHSEGGYNIASGACSHAEGNNTTASGDYSHAEGSVTTASGYASHAEGDYTKASSKNQHVQGQYNIEDTANKYVHIVGNGKKDKSTNYKEVRSNAHTLDWEGNAWYAGQVQGTNLPYTVSSKVLTTVPASNVKIDDNITVNNVSINKDKRYYIEFLGSKKLCSFLINEELGNSIICSIGNYEIDVFNDSTDIIVCITKINKDDTTATTFTDLIIHEEEVKYLDSKYLETDLILQNSISLGRVGNIGMGSSAIGSGTTASGNVSHAEGYYTKAIGNHSHAEGSGTTASGVVSHAEGNYTTASGNYSHAEGYYTKASGYASHTEGEYTKASSQYQHVQGKYNIEDTANKYAHIVGNGKKDLISNKEVRSNAHTLDWEGNAWYAGQVEGTNLPYTVSSKVLTTVTASNVKLDDPITVNNISINKDRRYYIEFLGSKKLCSMLISEEDGNSIICSIGNYAIQAYNNSTNISIDINKINENDTTTDTFTDLIIYEEEAKYLDSKYLETDLVLQNSISLGRIGDTGAGSSAIGIEVTASGDYGSHAEGWSTTASGRGSHAEGIGAIASDHGSHAEGYYTTASGKRSHAEGYKTIASNYNSHAEGWCTEASGNQSHAEGGYTVASAYCSHAEGSYTKASSENQHVQGKCNIEDTANKYAHIVGNGHYDEENKTEVRSNAHTLDWEGNGWYAGKLSQEGTPTEDKDLVTKKYVDEHSISVIDGFTMRDQTTNYRYLMQLRDGVLTSILLPSSISVDSSSLTNLMEGDVIEGNGLTINATYPDGTTSALSDSDKENITCTPKELTTDVKQITVKYKVGDYELTQIIDVTVSAFDPAVKLQDFNYTSNANGTYTLTGWKETHNGVASTEMIIPNNKKIIL